MNHKKRRIVEIDEYDLEERWYEGGYGQKDKYKILGKKRDTRERFELTKGMMNLTIPGVKRKINFLKSDDGVEFYNACGVSLRIRDAVVARLEEIILELKH